MKKCNEKGVANIDYVIALIVFVIGTIAALGLYLNVYTTMAKIKINETIIGYVTEVCETIDLESYESVNTVAKVNNLIRLIKIPQQYVVTCTGIEKYNNTSAGEEQDVIEKINFLVSYELAGNRKEYTVSKVKVKE